LVHLLVHPQAGLQHFSSNAHVLSLVQPLIGFGTSELTGKGRQKIWHMNLCIGQ
jgi:hypothetical protein